MSYEEAKSSAYEDKAIEIINNVMGQNIASRNNITDNDIDLLIGDFKFDVQDVSRVLITVKNELNEFVKKKSLDFCTDLVSACFFKGDSWKKTIEVSKMRSRQPTTNISQVKSDISSCCNVGKWGKFLDDDNKMGGVFYFVNFSLNSETLKQKDFTSIDKYQSYLKEKWNTFVFIPTSLMNDALVSEWNEIRSNKRFKFNDKSKYKIEENHQSAFSKFEVHSFCKKYNLPIISKNDYDIAIDDENRPQVFDSMRELVLGVVRDLTCNSAFDMNLKIVNSKSNSKTINFVNSSETGFFNIEKDQDLDFLKLSNPNNIFTYAAKTPSHEVAINILDTYVNKEVAFSLIFGNREIPNNIKIFDSLRTLGNISPDVLEITYKRLKEEQKKKGRNLI